MVPVEVVAKLHDILIDYINDVVEKNTNTIVLKYAVVIIQFLLECKTQEQWKNEEATMTLFKKLFNF